MIKSFLYKGRQFSIDNSKQISTLSQINKLSDFDENNDLILIDSRMPERFLMGIAIHEVEERKWIRQGYSLGQAHLKAQKKELQFYTELCGSAERGMERLADEERWILRLSIGDSQKQLVELEQGAREFVRTIEADV